jgi:glutathione synthase
MDPIDAINYKKDTTLALLWAARDQGWSLFYFEQQDLYSASGETRVRARPLSVFENPERWFELGDVVDSPLSELDIVLMRKDPPFDMEFFYSTLLLEDAERRGTLVVNRCQSLRNCNEKLFATEFPQCCPTLIVSRDMRQLRAFHGEHGDVVFKPLDGMGGSSIFRVREDDPNVGVILETLTEHGARTIMGQVYLPEIKQGDKRILMVNGEPIDHALARIPMAGESRGNLAAGGTGRVQPLSERDRWLAEQVGPTLRERGLWFVGLDVIGDYLTEINVTSPTCVREIEAETGAGIAQRLMKTLAEELEARGR